MTVSGQYSSPNKRRPLTMTQKSTTLPRVGHSSSASSSRSNSPGPSPKRSPLLSARKPSLHAVPNAGREVRSNIKLKRSLLATWSKFVYRNVSCNLMFLGVKNAIKILKCIGKIFHLLYYSCCRASFCRHFVKCQSCEFIKQGFVILRDKVIISVVISIYCIKKYVVKFQRLLYTMYPTFSPIRTRLRQ